MGAVDSCESADSVIGFQRYVFTAARVIKHVSWDLKP